MVKIKVSELLGKYKMSRTELSRITGIRINTISALYYETIKRLDVDMINSLCKAFNCHVSDLIEYIPDKE